MVVSIASSNRTRNGRMTGGGTSDERNCHTCMSHDLSSRNRAWGLQRLSLIEIFFRSLKVFS